MLIRLFLSGTFLFLAHFLLHAQSITQNMKGTVVDEAANTPIGYATITLTWQQFTKTTTSDSLGNFLFSNVPLGRYDITITAVGFSATILKEVVVSAGKETVVAATLRDNVAQLQTVVITPRVNKSKPINTMAAASARMFSVEEAKRYAGGFDDYARLASSFAGVAGNTANNGVVIRGNAPRLIQWKMEGVEIPNPNHFADLATFGGGGLTGLSSQLLDNSDFFTGAFPAEYSNALAGVFDMNMRKGNKDKRETTLQAGLLGIEAAVEGPFAKQKAASYLVNYRYSTLGLLAPLLPDNAEGTTYQDLSFKLHFPTAKAGTFSVWGIGLMDKSGATPKENPADWKYLQDKERQDVKQYMGATGISHRYFFNKKTHIKTTLAVTTNGIDLVTDRMDNSLQLQPQNVINNKTTNIIVSSYVNTKFNARHTNKTGITVTGLYYNLLLKEAPTAGSPLQTIVSEKGSSLLLNAYTSSSVRLSPKTTLIVGLSSQVFTLNGQYSIEPRLGLQYQLPNRQMIAVAYGLHSRLERLSYYFTKPSPSSIDLHNKNLGFTKAHHLVLSYSWQVSRNLHIKIEPYYQQLFDVPVIKDSSYSFINMENDWFLNKPLLNSGKGRNIGVDITIEKYITDGFYYLVSGSLFSSRYKGGDGVWRNTRFNKNYLFNILGGKEWQIGKEKKNVLGINLKLSYQGGDYYIPANETASVMEQDVVYDGSKAFTRRVDPVLVTHFTLSYKKNKKHSAHEWAFKIINATSQKEFTGLRYNLQTQRVDISKEALIVPNLSYKIEF